jgi:hypothetical protein
MICRWMLAAQAAKLDSALFGPEAGKAGVPAREPAARPRAVTML